MKVKWFGLLTSRFINEFSLYKAGFFITPISETRRQKGKGEREYAYPPFPLFSQN
jgi:hypothetical protein